MVTKTAKLSFSKDIVSTIEHHLSNKDVIERLADLHEELSHVEQENIDLKTLDKYKTQLIDKKLLKSKDPGIQAFTTCCISDILRIYAPDAPYTENELTDIFKVFFSQFKLLTNPDNGYYIQQVYLLTKLVEVRSVVLITDLPQSDKLVHELFKVFYNPENNQFPSKLWGIISDLLEEVIAEAESLTMDVLKLMFNKFLTYNPVAAPKGLQITQDASFQFSLQICENSSGRLNRYLTRFYTEILYNMTKISSSNHAKNNADDKETQGEASFIDEITSVNYPGFKALSKLHTLVLKLWEYVPDLVSSVSGFLYQELYSSNELFRVATTKLVGDLLSSPTSSLNFSSSNAEIYKAWLTKIADTSSKVRIAWVKTIPGILNSGSAYINEQFCNNICQGLSKTLIDTDFKVRMESVLIFMSINTEILWTYFKNPVIFNELLHLTREKNVEIRENAITYVCEFYNTTKKCNYNILISNAALTDFYSKIPTTLLNLYYINDKSINQFVDILFIEKILPYTEESNDKRVESIVELLSTLDSKAKQSFFAFQKRQVELHSVVYKFMDCAEKITAITDNESQEYKTVNSHLQQIIKWLSFGLSDAFNVTTILETLVSLNNKRIFEILKKIVSSETSYQQLLKYFRELHDKLKDTKLFSSLRLTSMFTRQDFAIIIKLLSYRSAFIVYNKSNIPIFLEKTTSAINSDDKVAQTCSEIVDHISINIPSAFKDETSSLLNIVKTHSSGDELLLETLKTLYRIGKVKLEYITENDSFFTDKLLDLAQTGTPYEAQYSCKILMLFENSVENVNSIVSSILPITDSVTPTQILVLAEIFASSHHEALNDNSTDIVTYVLANILLKNSLLVSGVKDNEKEWIDDQKLSLSAYTGIAKKIFGLKLITNNLISVSKNLKEDEKDKEILIIKSLKLFFFLIESGGELIVNANDDNSSDSPTPIQYQKKLRLEAALQILKLAEQPVLNNYISSMNVEKLINIIEDESLEIRSEFLNTLKKYISEERISIKFLPLIFFVAFEPDKDLKKQTKLWIHFTSNKQSFQKTSFFERGFSRFIHYIAHHPDIQENLGSLEPEANNSQILSNAVEYIMYYLENILTKENISLLFYLSNRVKQYQDIDETDESSQNIYIISELIQMILVEYKQVKNWDIPIYQGKLNLPTDLYSPITDSEKQNKIIMTKFLKDEQVLIIKNILKFKSLGSKGSHGSARRDKVSAASTKSKPTQTKKRKRVARFSNNDSDDSDDDEDAYKAPKNKKVFTVVRKSNRAKQQVNYDEKSDIEEDQEENDI